MRNRHSWALRAFALAAVAACGGDTPVEPPPPPVPTQLTMVTQPAGSVANGVTLPIQPSVRLRDASGVPVAKAGVSVSVTLVGAGAVLSGTTTVITDISGIAAFTGLRITGTIGSYTLRFASSGLTGVDANAITLTPGAPTTLTLAVTPSTTAQAGAALAQQPSVQLKDQSGNNTPVANVTVTATLVSGTATVSNATAVTTSQGLAAFSGLALSGPVGTYTLRFTSTGLTAVDAAPTAMAAGPATQLVVTTQPSATLVNGATLATQPVVELHDAFGNTATQAGVAVTASILSGTGTLSGTATVNTDAAGKATFTDLAITGTAGSFTLRFAATNLAAAVSGAITLTAGTATKLGITTAPPIVATNGVALTTQPVVQVQDASGNAVTTAGIVVTAAPVPGGPAVTNGTATTDAAGKATFSGLTLTGVSGGYFLAFSATGLTPDTSATLVALQPGAAAALVLTTQPDTVATNGVALVRQPVARLQDASGNNTPAANVTVTATLVSGSATLGSATATTNASGVATFAGLNLTGTIGSYTLRFTATGIPSVDASASTRLKPGAATQVALTTQPPAAAQSGVALTTQPVVQLRDVSGNAVAQSGVTVTAAVSTGSASASSATAVTNASGIATFSGLTLSGVPGSNTLSFSASGLTAATAAAPTILTAGPAAAVTLTTQPAAAAQSGIALTAQPVVQLRDGTGNPVPQPGVTVTATVVSGALTLANATATTDAAGAATFSGLTLTGLVGTYTLRFTAAGIGSVDATAPTSLSAGTAAAVTLTTQPSAAVQSGSTLTTQPVVQLRDGAGNAVALAGVTVSASLVTGSLTLTNAAATTDAAGAAAFAGLTLTGAAGSYTLRFTASGVGSVNAAAATVVSAGPATQLALQTQPSGFAVNGAALAQQPVVRVLDASGNLVTSSSVLITAVTGSGVTLTNATVTAAGGIASFSGLTMTGTPGAYILNFTAGGLTPVAATVTTLGAGAPVAVTLTTQPSIAAQSGVALATQPVAQLRDGSGNPVPQSGVVVTASLVSGSLVLLNSTATTDGTGAATFSGLTLTGATGSYTLRFTATGIGTVTAASATALGPGAASAVTLTTQPATAAQSGVALTTQPVLQLRDGTGNPVLQSGVTVTASLVSGALTLGNASVMTDAGGTATFTALTLTGTVGSYALRFTASGVGSVDALAATALSAGPAAQLALQTQPSTSTTTGVALTRQPVVRVLDGAGNLVTSSAAVIAAGTTPGVAVSNQNATAASGVATFSGLTLTGTAGSYTLSFSSAGLTGVSASAATVVGVGPAAGLTFNTTPSTSAANGTVLAQQPAVVVKDASNNPIAGATVTVTANNGGTVLNGAATTNVSGVATFTALALAGTAQPYTLTFTSGAAANTAGVTLTAGAATTVTISQQPSTSATNGTALAQQPIVHVTDGTNPVPGAVVTASLTTAGATLGNPTATTDGSGNATFSGLYLYGTAPASYTVQFTVSGVAPVPASSATSLTAGAAAKLVLTTQPSANAQVGTALASQPVVQITDAGGNVVAQSGTIVTASVIGGGATLSGASAMTSVGGAASFGSLALTGTIGSYTLRFTAPGLDSVDATAATALAAGPATELALTTQPATLAQSGVALTTQPAVQLRDEGGNAVAQSGIAVTASVVGGGATVAGASATTNGAGVATFSTLAVSGAVGPYTLRFTSPGITGVDAASTTTISAGAPAAVTVITEPPTTAVNAVALTTAPVVEVVDGAGNPVSGVALSAAASGSVAVTNASAVSQANGRATYTGLTLTGTAGAHTLQFCVGPCASATIGVSASQATTIAAGAPAAIGVSTAPSGAAQSGVALASQPVVIVTDVSGNPVAGATVTATASGASVGGASVVTNASGVATFTALTVSGTPGSYTLQIATGAASTTSPLTLSTGPAAVVTFSTAPSSTAQNGAVLAQQPVVLVKDGTGNPVAGAVVTVTADNGGTVLNGTATTNGSGLATFSTLALTGTAGPYTLTFTAGAASTAAGFSLTAGAATTIAITQQPSTSATNGAALATQPVVQVTDGTNGVQGLVVTASLTAGGASVGNASAITDGTGHATFSGLTLSGTAPASYTLRFTVSGLAPVTAASATTLNPGPAAKLVLATQPSTSATNGAALASQPVVQITDAGGNVVLTSGTVVNASLVGGGPALANAAATSTSGVATFSGLTLTGAVGSYTLRFVAAGLDSVDASAATVLQPGPASHLALTVQPSAAATNAVALSQQPVVRVLDASGNLVTSSAALVTASTSAGVTLANSGVTASGGVAAFTGLTLTGSAGNYTLSFAASGVTGVSALSATVLSSGPASQLTLTTQPSTTARSGATLLQQPVVQLRDASGNAVAQSGVTVTASVVSGILTLGSQTATTNPSGTATFSGLTLSGPVGSYTLRFAASGVTSVDASAATALTAGAPASLVIVTAPPVTAVSGVALSPVSVIEVRDGSGNPVPDSTVTAFASGSVTLTSASAVAQANGRATFTGLTLTGTVAGYSLQFCVGPCASASVFISAAQPIALQPGAPATMTVTTAPSAAAQSGIALVSQPVVTVKDVSGNPVPGVTVTATAGAASVSGGSVVTDGSGVATFTALTVSGAPNSYSLQLASGAAVSSSSLTLSTGPAASVSFNTAPSSSAADGVVLGTQPVVLVKDATNNPIAGITVTVTANLGASVLNGTVTTNGSGLATFSALALDGSAPQSYTLTFTAGPASTTAPLSLTAGPASALTVFTQPSASATNGTALAQQPVVHVVDGGANPVAGVVVTATLTTAGATVGNATATTNGSGDATFVGLYLSGAAPASYTLQFAAAGLAPVAASAATALSPGAPVKLVLSTQPSTSATNGAALATQPVVRIADAGGNFVSQSGTLVTAAVVGGGPALANATSTTDGSGVAAFSGLKLTGTVGSYTLRFTASALDSVTAAAPTVLGAGAATAAVLTTQPAFSAHAGAALPRQPVLQLVDQSGNSVSQAGVAITAITPGNALTLQGTTTVLTSAAGIASFTDLGGVGPAERYLFQFTSASPGFTVDASDSTVIAAPLTVGVPVADSGHVDSEHPFVVTTQPGDTLLVVTISGDISSTADLAVRFGAAPNIELGLFDCYPRLAGSNEECRFRNPTPGDWYVTLLAYPFSFQGVTVTVNTYR